VVLYRFLFAPVLLAIAALTASPHRPAVAAPPSPAHESRPAPAAAHPPAGIHPAHVVAPR
jgi:hypothetical protein